MSSAYEIALLLVATHLIAHTATVCSVCYVKRKHNQIDLLKFCLHSLCWIFHHIWTPNFINDLNFMCVRFCVPMCLFFCSFPGDKDPIHKQESPLRQSHYLSGRPRQLQVPTSLILHVLLVLLVLLACSHASFLHSEQTQPTSTAAASPILPPSPASPTARPPYTTKDSRFQGRPPSA